MIEFLLSLSTWLGITVSMALATAAGLLVYGISNKLIARYENVELKDPTSSLFRVVGMLVSLMLSLAFAEVVLQQRAVENAVDREAIAIGDTFMDLRRFGVEKTRESQTILLDYTQVVIDDDWPALANDKLSDNTRALKQQLLDSVWNLEPATPAEEKLLSQILADIDVISEHRWIRLDNALSEPPVYIYAIIFGFLVTMACFGVYRPHTPLIALVSLYTVFIGLVLYLVLAISDPFRGGLTVDPVAFEHLIELLRAEFG